MRIAHIIFLLFMDFINQLTDTEKRKSRTYLKLPDEDADRLTSVEKQ